jgi:putative salt-induced outer membrane protein
MKKSLLCTGLLLASIGNAVADDETKSLWSGTGQLGFTSTSGNSDTTSITAGLAGKYENDKWISSMGLDILKATASGVDTAERFIISSTTGYKFDENDYVFYGSRYENDNFSAFDYTMTTSVGWGHKFEDTDKARLITEIGLGYKIEALDIDRTENAGLAITGKLDYMRQLTETMKFENITIVESTSDNTFLQNDAGFSFKVSDKAAVKLSHQLRHNTDVPVGTDNTDTLVSVNLVYGF